MEKVINFEHHPITSCLFSDHICHINTMVLAGTLLVVTQIIPFYFCFSFNCYPAKKHVLFLYILYAAKASKVQKIFKLAIKYLYVFSGFNFDENITLKVLRKNK